MNLAVVFCMQLNKIIDHRTKLVMSRKQLQWIKPQYATNKTTVSRSTDIGGNGVNYITLQEVEGMPAFVDKPKVPQ